MEINDVTPGDVYTNQELCNIFQVSPQGGMRRSLKTNTLVLISQHEKDTSRNPYADKWTDGVLHYTGMGTKGDQSLTFAQNKTLLNATELGVTLHLFEVYKAKEYTYRGQVELNGEPYPSTETDLENKKRLVYKFPLSVKL